MSSYLNKLEVEKNLMGVEISRRCQFKSTKYDQIKHKSVNNDKLDLAKLAVAFNMFNECVEYGLK